MKKCGFIGYLFRGLAHLRKGTILKKIKRQLDFYNKNRRKIWWDKQKQKREYFEITLQRGIRMRLFFDSILSQLIYCDGFEVQEQQFVNAFLRPGDTFVDVGANIGLFSLIAAQRLGNTGSVYAFEPTSKVFERLCQNVKLNRYNNIFLFNTALSDKIGESRFFISQDGYDAWNSFSPSTAGNVLSTEIVKCDTWDNFSYKHNLIDKVTMMKIDVEGWETRLLSGGYETLSRKEAPVLQVEFTDEAAQAAGSSCEKLYNLLESLGFQMFIYDAKLHTLIHDPIRNAYPYLNLIATKNPRRIIDRLNERSDWLSRWQRITLYVSRLWDVLA
jgi:FkbM family methyltransferase